MVGERLRYSVSYAVSARGGSEQQGLDIHLDGHLELTCLSATERGGALRGEWQGAAKVTRDGKEEPGIVSLLDGGLRQPFFFERDSAGQLVELRFPTGVLRLSQTLTRSLLTSAQLVRGAAADDLWQSDEIDENGSYVAQYERAGAGKLRKQKLRYRSSHGQNVRHRILESEIGPRRRGARARHRAQRLGSSSMPSSV